MSCRRDSIGYGGVRRRMGRWIVPGLVSLLEMRAGGEWVCGDVEVERG